MSDAEAGEGAGARTFHPGFKVLLGLLPLVAVVVALRASGLLEGLEPERIRVMVADLGPLGPVGYILVYVIGIVAHVPGAIFVAAGVLAYGPLGGLALAYAGASAANLICFGLGRLGLKVGLAEPATEEHASGHFVVQLRRSRAWSLLASRPILAVTLVRVVFPTTAAVSAMLAFTRVRWLAYAVGSLIGVWPQLAVTVALFSWAFQA